jgi:hypothetical protein
VGAVALKEVVIGVYMCDDVDLQIRSDEKQQYTSCTATRIRRRSNMKSCLQITVFKVDSNRDSPLLRSEEAGHRCNNNTTATRFCLSCLYRIN